MGCHVVHLHSLPVAALEAKVLERWRVVAVNKMVVHARDNSRYAGISRTSAHKKELDNRTH